MECAPPTEGGSKTLPFEIIFSNMISLQQKQWPPASEISNELMMVCLSEHYPLSGQNLHADKQRIGCRVKRQKLELSNSQLVT